MAVVADDALAAAPAAGRRSGAWVRGARAGQRGQQGVPGYQNHPSLSPHFDTASGGAVLALLITIASAMRKLTSPAVRGPVGAGGSRGRAGQRLLSRWAAGSRRAQGRPPPPWQLHVASTAEAQPLPRSRPRAPHPASSCARVQGGVGRRRRSRGRGGKRACRCCCGGVGRQRRSRGRGGKRACRCCCPGCGGCAAERGTTGARTAPIGCRQYPMSSTQCQMQYCSTDAQSGQPSLMALSLRTHPPSQMTTSASASAACSMAS